MTRLTQQQVLAVCDRFAFGGAVTDLKVCGNGHINSTYIVTAESGERYILQILNTAIFKDPTGVMNNIAAVTDHIRKGLAEAGEDTERGTMQVILTKDGANGYTDEDGRFWRAYDFVEGTVCRLTVDSPDTFARVGEAFGDFQRRLADFDASRLYESIPNFHNTKKRYADFLAAVERDSAGRVAAVQDEIRFIMDRADKCSLIVDALESGDLPLRVTHNDTKLSNILLDEVTEEAVCIIDLDTVMPGSSLYDFGDSIRTGAASAAEDEPNLDKVHFLPEMFKAVARCFCFDKFTTKVFFDSDYEWEVFDISYEDGELIINSLYHDHDAEPYCEDCDDNYRLIEEDGIEICRCECGHTMPVEEYKASCEQYFENVYAIL